jgi:hypothetical protein
MAQATTASIRTFVLRVALPVAAVSSAALLLAVQEDTALEAAPAYSAVGDGSCRASFGGLAAAGAFGVVARWPLAQIAADEDDENTCSGHVELSAPGSFVGAYANGASCSWHLTCPDGGVPELTFATFSTESGYDYVTVLDGAPDTRLHTSGTHSSSGDTPLLRTSGSSLPGPVVATGGNMTVTLRADSGIVRSGFTASFDCSSIAAGGAEDEVEDDERQATVCARICDTTESCIGYTVEEEVTYPATGCGLILSTLGGAQPEQSQHRAGTFVKLAEECDTSPRACRVGDTWTAGMDYSDTPRRPDGSAECGSHYTLSYSEGQVHTVNNIDGACFRSTSYSRWAPLAAGSCSCALATGLQRGEVGMITGWDTNDDITTVHILTRPGQGETITYNPSALVVVGVGGSEMTWSAEEGPDQGYGSTKRCFARDEYETEDSWMVFGLLNTLPTLWMIAILAATEPFDAAATAPGRAVQCVGGVLIKLMAALLLPAWIGITCWIGGEWIGSSLLVGLVIEPALAVAGVQACMWIVAIVNYSCCKNALWVGAKARKQPAPQVDGMGDLCAWVYCIGILSLVPALIVAWFVEGLKNMGYGIGFWYVVLGIKTLNALWLLCRDLCGKPPSPPLNLSRSALVSFLMGVLLLHVPFFFVTDDEHCFGCDEGIFSSVAAEDIPPLYRFSLLYVALACAIGLVLAVFLWLIDWVRKKVAAKVAGPPATAAAPTLAAAAGGSVEVDLEAGEGLEAPRDFYHGTSLEAALKIQEEGFRVDLAGSNAGTMLGKGCYVTTSLEKALNYAKHKNADCGAIFRLDVDLGQCMKVQPLKTNGGKHNVIEDWHKQGFDSVWSPDGVNGQREEHCIRDPTRRVKIIDIILGNTRAARMAGFELEGGRLVRIDANAAAAKAEERQVARTLIAFYLANHPEFANDEKVQRIIARFKAKAAKSESGEGWKHLLFAAYKKEGVDLHRYLETLDLAGAAVAPTAADATATEVGSPQLLPSANARP